MTEVLRIILAIPLILSVIPRSSAATGTNHMRTATSVEHGSHEMPRSSAAIGSFTTNALPLPFEVLPGQYEESIKTFPNLDCQLLYMSQAYRFIFGFTE